MNYTEIIKTCKKNKESFYTLLVSDLHIGSKGIDKKAIEAEFQEAKDKDANILINGDIGEFILPKDNKRYSAGGDKYGTDNHINKTIDEILEFLTPYKDNIRLIGMGNHETSVLKYNGFDPVQQVIYSLNREGGNIDHGQYCGFVRFKYRKGESLKGGSQTEDLYYNHGQGGKAEISKGAIDLNRMMTSKDASIYWIGHKHTKLVLPDERVVYADKKGNIKDKVKTGVVTGSYKRNGKSYNAIKKGYELSFGEENFRTNQSCGGVFLKHTIDLGGCKIIRNWII